MKIQLFINFLGFYVDCVEKMKRKLEIFRLREKSILPCIGHQQPKQTNFVSQQSNFLSSNRIKNRICSFFSDLTVESSRKTQSPPKIISYKAVNSVVPFRQKNNYYEISDNEYEENLSTTNSLRNKLINRIKRPVKLDYRLKKLNTMMERKYNVTPLRVMKNSMEIGCQSDL